LPDGRRRTAAAALPAWVKPQLTELVDQPLDGPAAAVRRAMAMRFAWQPKL
jgi:hypothetical protein